MRFYIKRFNPLFFILLFITTLLAYLYKLIYLYYGKTICNIVFIIIYILKFIYYFKYHIDLSKDKEFEELCIRNNVPKSSLLSEIIPLQLCNISYILLPLGIVFDIEPFIGFGLLMAPFSVLIALLMPYPGLSNDSLLKPRIAGFYFTHLFILFMSLTIWMTKEYTIDYQLAFEVFILLIICSFVAHITNRILYNTCLCKEANYFYTMDPSFNSLAYFFYKLIPIKWIYEFPIFIIIWLIFNIFVYIYNFFI